MRKKTLRPESLSPDMGKPPTLHRTHPASRQFLASLIGDFPQLQGIPPMGKPISKNPSISSCGNLNGNAICWPKCPQTFLPFQVSCRFVCVPCFELTNSQSSSPASTFRCLRQCRPKGLAKAFTSKSTNSFSWL